jgi:ribosomal protein L6P/L9E
MVIPFQVIYENMIVSEVLGLKKYWSKLLGISYLHFSFCQQDKKLVFLPDYYQPLSSMELTRGYTNMEVCPLCVS